MLVERRQLETLGAGLKAAGKQVDETGWRERGSGGGAGTAGGAYWHPSREGGCRARGQVGARTRGGEGVAGARRCGPGADT